MTKTNKLLIFGPPGCGKGTISSFVTKDSDITHISMGEMIRAHIAAADDIGRQAKELVSQGKLISDDVTNEMISQRLSKDDAQGSFLLDGYPRDIYQAEFITTIVQLSGVIVITLADELIMERLLARGRADDIPETIKGRIQLYKDTTQPVLDFLERKNIPFLEVNGDYDLNTEKDAMVQNIQSWLASL